MAILTDWGVLVCLRRTSIDFNKSDLNLPGEKGKWSWLRRVAEATAVMVVVVVVYYVGWDER